ncbi:Luciferase-like monooxygenase [Rhodococcus sp. AW25M09]|uniref:LLM class flavin-dependent oxidoreductase n=1 Tax=Rhodococcus sp. AW25M09 TaxID=1268303 RepID=UPI0002AC94E0|nr:LLM class flavin-dependent oxidoreductase [Rhodococcus sp. AW25M09]CCQ17500.1 Luciferase-like monooxygenase [Rhodococcus sp. AW25M09]
MLSLSDSRHFALGLFSANCSSGLAVTKVPERWSGSWEDNLAAAQIADEAGLDFLLPIARWIGYGGETNFHEGVLEPIAWAAALLARTSNITVFATVHTAFNHPIVTAKQIATLDRIGGGRAGLNIVAGWNEPEYRAFGMELPSNHDDRYAFGQEWLDVVTKLWTEVGPFDFDGDFFHLEGVHSDPKPLKGRVPVLNAGASPQGRAFAARNADFLFTPVQDFDNAAATVTDVRAAAKTNDRSIGVLTLSHVVCRPTEQEALDYLEYYADTNADWQAVDNLMALQGLHAQSFSPEMLANFRPRFAAGHGSYPLVGTPDQIADSIEKLAASGLAGTTLAFVDYAAELPYFVDQVLPRLRQRGLRV